MKDYTLSPARQCKECLRVRNLKLHFGSNKTVCKECLSDRYTRRTEQEKEGQLQQTIQQHYTLY